MDRYRRKLRVLRRSPKTERPYVARVLKFIRFHKLRHPDEMSEPDIEQFVTYLAV